MIYISKCKLFEEVINEVKSFVLIFLQSPITNTKLLQLSINLLIIINFISFNFLIWLVQFSCYCYFFVILLTETIYFKHLVFDLLNLYKFLIHCFLLFKINLLRKIKIPSSRCTLNKRMISKWFSIQPLRKFGIQQTF